MARNEEWLADGADVLPFVRCAWLVMFKTKDELETVVKGLINDKSFEGTWDGIERAQGFFEGFMTVLKAAEMRLMSAATAVALAGGAE